jgi:hypothetical protein
MPDDNPIPALDGVVNSESGDLAVVSLGSPWPVVAPVKSLASEGPTSEAWVEPVLGMSGAGVASQGTTSIEVVGAGARIGDDAESMLRDLVMCDTEAGVPRSPASDDVAPAPGSSGAMGLVVSGLHLSGSPGFPPLPFN